MTCRTEPRPRPDPAVPTAAPTARTAVLAPSTAPVPGRSIARSERRIDESESASFATLVITLPSTSVVKSVGNRSARGTSSTSASGDT